MSTSDDTIGTGIFIPDVALECQSIAGLADLPHPAYLCPDVESVVYVWEMSTANQWWADHSQVMLHSGQSCAGHAAQQSASIAGARSAMLEYGR